MGLAAMGERPLDEAFEGRRIADLGLRGRGRKRARRMAEWTLGGGAKAPGGKRSGMSVSVQRAYITDRMP